MAESSSPSKAARRHSHAEDDIPRTKFKAFRSKTLPTIGGPPPTSSSTLSVSSPDFSAIYETHVLPSKTPRSGRTNPPQAKRSYTGSSHEGMTDVDSSSEMDQDIDGRSLSISPSPAEKRPRVAGQASPTKAPPASSASRAPPTHSGNTTGRTNSRHSPPAMASSSVRGSAKLSKTSSEPNVLVTPGPYVASSASLRDAGPSPVARTMPRPKISTGSKVVSYTGSSHDGLTEVESTSETDLDSEDRTFPVSPSPAEKHPRTTGQASPTKSTAASPASRKPLSNPRQALSRANRTYPLPTSLAKAAPGLSKASSEPNVSAASGKTGVAPVPSPAAKSAFTSRAMPPPVNIPRSNTSQLPESSNAHAAVSPGMRPPLGHASSSTSSWSDLGHESPALAPSFGPPPAPYVIAHDSGVQREMDSRRIQWGVQYNIAWGVSTGLWTWSQVTASKLDRLKGSCFSSMPQIVAIIKGLEAPALAKGSSEILGCVIRL